MGPGTTGRAEGLDDLLKQEENRILRDPFALLIQHGDRDVGARQKKVDFVADF